MGWVLLSEQDVKDLDKADVILMPYGGYAQSCRQIVTPAIVRAILAEDKMYDEQERHERQQEMWA